MVTTKVDDMLRQTEESVAEGDPERAEVVARARRFKSSWVELAEALTRVRKTNAWRRWGYESLDDYAKRELHLRQETVDKLTGSFSFLKSKAPEVLARDGIEQSVPSYQAVDFWRRAEETSGVSGEAIEQIRNSVLEGNASPAKLKKEFGAEVFPIDPKAERQRDAAAIRNVAMRLRDLSAETKVLPRKLAGELGEVLSRVLDALEQGESKVA